MLIDKKFRLKTPALQIALDITSKESLYKLLTQIPDSERILLEAGTPLIKMFGLDIIDYIRKYKPNSYIIADLKTLDVGGLEFKMAADKNADAATVSGLAPIETINLCIKTAREHNILSCLDLMNVDNFQVVFDGLKDYPDIVLIHRGIDQESSYNTNRLWDEIDNIKKETENHLLVAVAGGITPESSEEALRSGADIIVVGRYITTSSDVGGAIDEFLEQL